MAIYGAAVEYGLHCLLLLLRTQRPSARDLAEFQGLSPGYLAKLFTRLQKAGLVRAVEGVDGGFELARPPDRITVLEVAEALEAGKKLFDCQDIRHRCVLFDGRPPDWAKAGTCGINAVMLRAEREMRRVLREATLADLAAGVSAKMPPAHARMGQEWFAERMHSRRERKDGEG